MLVSPVYLVGVSERANWIFWEKVERPQNQSRT